MKQTTSEGRRILSLILTAALLLGLVLPGAPIPIFAADSGYEHVHDEDCGYVEGAPCEHEHDEGCGYTEDEEGRELTPCEHEHKVNDAAGGREGPLGGNEDCGYIEPSPCTYVRSESETGADDGGPSLGESGVATPTNLTAFAPLEDAIRWQGFDAGTVQLADITLPDTLEAEDGDGVAVTVTGVTWACTDPDTGFDGDADGLYTFTAALRDEYTLADGVELPQITVIIRPQGGAAIMPASLPDEYGIVVNGDPANTTIVGMGGEQWYVIGEDSDSWTLLATDVTGNTTAFGSNRTYDGSTLKTEIESLYSSIFTSEWEQAAIDDVNLTDISPNITNAKLWPLSTGEANAVSQSLRVASDNWWLRSPGSFTINAAVVSDGGHVNSFGDHVSSLYGIRPAFQLNLDSVIFTSDASSTAPTVEDSSLTDFLTETRPREIKLTLNTVQTSLNGFSVTNPVSLTGETGGTVDIDYTHASGTPSGNEFLRVQLIQNDSIMYHGVIAANLSTSGDTVQLPLTDVEPGAYQAEIWVEQAGGPDESNIASKPETFPLTVSPASASLTGGETVYFGISSAENGPYTTAAGGDGMAWRVLEAENGELWLFAEDVLFESGQNNPMTRLFDISSNTWSTSDLHGWLNGAYLDAAFTEWEQAVIIHHPYTTELNNNGSGSRENNQSHIFLLDLADVRNSGVADNNSLLSARDNWWLRSPGGTRLSAAFVSNTGIVDLGSYLVHDKRGIRPAFKLPLSSVIFTSDVSGANVKPITVGDTSLSALAPTGAQKITLLTDEIKLEDVVLLNTGANLSFSYGEATVGSGHYLSAALLDDSGKLAYYGKLEELHTTASGSVTVPLSGVADGSYTLLLFNEQANGGYNTDYAGNPYALAITITSGTAQVDFAPAINGQTAGTDAITLTAGYTTPHTEAYTITGNPAPSVSVSSSPGISGIHVSNHGVLTIPTGLAAGTYTITITASNSAGIAAMTVTVTVNQPTNPQPNGRGGGSGGGGNDGSNVRPEPKTTLPATAFSWDGARTLTIDHERITPFGLLTVQWDGAVLERGTEYGVYEGSVIVRFDADFIAAQSPGEHTVRVEFLDHTGEATVTVGETGSGEAAAPLHEPAAHPGGGMGINDNPDTGGYPDGGVGGADNPGAGDGRGVWAALLLGSVGAAALTIMRRFCNEH